MITTGCFIKHNSNIARNEHLMPEIVERKKALLSQAQREHKNAINAYPCAVDYYQIKRTGRPCTCYVVTDNEGDVTDLSFKDFLMSQTLELKPENYCPICFGTKRIGGYNHYGYNTVVLTSADSPRVSGVNLVKSSPFYYASTNTLGSVTWRLSVPQYFESCQVAIRWNVKPSQYSLEVNGSTTYDWADLKGQRVELTLKMRDSVAENAGVYAVFLDFKIGDSLNVDMPRDTVKYTGELNVVDEVESQITINFDGNVVPTTKDILIDPKGLLWRILEVERNDPHGVNISQNANARLVRKFETGYLLPNPRLNLNYNLEYTFLNV